jgi:hypothetical protein
MRRSVQKRVGKISDRPGQQDQCAAKPGAQQARYHTEEQGDGNGIAQRVCNVGV